MSRKSNDNRSDSLNPNNGAYHASEANRNNQTAAYDVTEHSENDMRSRALPSESLNITSNRGLDQVKLIDSTYDKDSKENWGIRILDKDRKMSSHDRALNSMCEAMLSHLTKTK